MQFRKDCCCQHSIISINNLTFIPENQYIANIHREMEQTIIKEEICFEQRLADYRVRSKSNDFDIVFAL